MLYANLSDKDGGAVIAQLSQMNVPYRMSEGGAAILVPAAQVHDLRLKMATAGLPKGTVSGFELMDNARFGQTQFQERLTFQRGLEGELTRSISSLAAVEAARVHLALPNQNGFFREQQKPSASVLLTLHPGRTLDRAQIAGIVHLVSSSVPEMSPKAVSVLDQSGALLTGGAEGAAGAGLDAQQLQYVNQIEAGYTKRIVELVEPIVGHDNLRASVTAEIDFSQTEATSEEFKPNQGADASVSIRSQQTTEQGGGSGTALASGIPGAASNQPPIAATAPLTGASQPLHAAAAGIASGTGGRREAVTNYEVDKTVRVIKSATGNVKRLNAAVVVNNRSVTDAKGKIDPGAARRRRDREDHRARARVDRLQPGARRLGQGRQRAVQGRSAGRHRDVVVLEEPRPDRPRARRRSAGRARDRRDARLLRPRAPGGEDRARRAPGAAAAPRRAASTPSSMTSRRIRPALAAPTLQRQIEGAKALAKDNPAAVAGIVRGWVGGNEAA